MNIEDTIKETLEEILKHLDVNFSKIEITEKDEETYHTNIESDDPSLLIGYRGANIQALQHLLKTLAWKKLGSDKQFHVILDIDDYRKRQEENIIALAERKVEAARKSKRPQPLPPMSAYFRRKVHLHLMGSGFDDVETISKDEGERRYIVIQLKT